MENRKIRVNSTIPIMKEDFINLDAKTLQATNNDPQIILHLERTCEDFFVCVKIETQEVMNDTIFVYYTYQNEDGDDYVFSVENSAHLAMKERQGLASVVNANQKANVLRIDPSESVCQFVSITIDIIALDNVNGMLSLFEFHGISKTDDGIVLVSHDLSRTGAPTLLFEIAKILKGEGTQVIVLAQNGGQLFEEFILEEIPCFVLGGSFFHLDLVKNKECFFTNLILTLRTFGFNRALLNTIIAGNVAQSFSKIGYRLISLIHEMKTTITLYEFGKYGNAIAQYCDKVVFPDQVVCDEFKQLFEIEDEKCNIRPQGCFAKEYETENLEPQRKYIVGLGSYSLRKGSDLYYQAALQFMKQNDEYDFIWIGNCGEKELFVWLEYELEKAKQKHRLKVIPSLTQEAYYGILSNASAFWLTSREDPFPNVMIDAIQANIPVIAFAGTGGAQTTLADGRGILVDNFDIEEYVKQTILLLCDENKKHAMTNRAKLYAQEHFNFIDYVEFLKKL